ncbi:MAG: DUF3703 domain-containing protein [Owenweeksia sp.]
MKFNTSMPQSLLPYFRDELDLYKQEYQRHDLQQAWRHLERAHVLGQAYPYAHSYVHWKMLQFGFRIKSFKEILGQIPRLLAGGVKSFVGQIPVGNTGGADIPPLRSLPIEHDIQDIFRKAGVKH